MSAGGPSDRSLVLLLPKQVRQLPADLVAVIGLASVACLVVLTPGLNQTPLRIVFGLPLVIFLPGYALVAALFPEGGSSPTERTTSESVGEDTATEQPRISSTGDPAGTEEAVSSAISKFSKGGDRGIDGIERVALSFGLSIAVVPLLGLLLNFTPWGIRLGPVLMTIVGFTFGATAVAAVRRRTLPAEQRFRVPYRAWLAAGRRELLEPNSRLDGGLNVLLVVSVLLAMGAVTFAVVVPPDGESFTEFYVLNEDENEELVTANYPTEFTVGESQPIWIGIDNREGERSRYTVVVQLQRLEVDGNETTVVEREELDRFSPPPLADSETYRTEYEIQPTMVGEDLRLQFLLYRTDVPAEPTRVNAYRDLNLWLDVAGR